MRIIYRFNGQSAAVGDIDPLPGSTQIGVFHSSFVVPHLRDQGIGTEAHEDRLKKAKTLLYDFVLCTVDEKNTAQVNILEKANWRCIETFISRKTGHRVLIYGKILNELSET